ncbi:MAG: phosphodiester glycosidase family protein, partial [bacterium]|nr:phosphodiester glycosidase family protein [bacterium]
MTAALPPTIAPPAPFPEVLAQRRRYEEVAPGVARAEYDLRTSAGPLVIRVIAADLSNPTVHLRTTLAGGRLISAGERVSAMAERSDAVAGINGDFFDIERSNAPLNALVQDGVVLRSPGYGRPALGVLADGRVVLGTPRLAGTVSSADGQAPLSAVDVWPADGYALLLPAYGAPPPPGALALADGSSLAFPDSLPAPAPPISVAAQITIDDAPLQQAVGGGPLLLRDGEPYDDPTAPKNGSDKAQFPVSGVGLSGEHTLLLVEVDGHQPGYSVGVTRAQFTALFESLSAHDAMGLDSGGSSTIVARKLGEGQAVLLNRPSDGRERPVADALMVMSSAPSGPPVRLVAHPAAIRALVGAQSPLHVAAVDAGDHPQPLPAPLRIAALPATLGRLEDQTFTAAAGSGMLAVASGELRAEVPVEIVTTIDRLEIDAPTANPAPGSTLQLRAVGYDAQGDPVAVGGVVRWQSSGAGTIDAGGEYRAPGRNGNAVITAIAGGARAQLALGTGSHGAPLPWEPAWFSFTSYPRGGGSVALDPGCRCLALRYDFTQEERGAYARTAIGINGAPVAFSVEVEGDGNGEWLRMRVADAAGRRYALTLAPAVDWTGWRRVAARMPVDAPAPYTI